MQRCAITILGSNGAPTHGAPLLFSNGAPHVQCAINSHISYSPFSSSGTLNETVQFVHEVHPVFAVILSTFAHMLCGSNDDTMPSFNLFRVQVVALCNFKVI